MKKRLINTFEKGINSDLHPLNTPKNIMTDALNASVTTTHEEQLIIQNAEGLDEIATLSDGFKHIASKEYEGILYIISSKESTNEIEIGSYPGFKPLSTDTGGNHTAVDLENSYHPFYNFYRGSGSYDNDSNYTSPFRTTKIPLNLNNKIDLEIQSSYDGSINVIFTDNENSPRIVNSRFKPLHDKYIVAERRQDKDSNTYSDKNIDNTKLILEDNTSIAKLYLKGIGNNGSLRVGGYRFFFRYEDEDGNVSNIIEESRLVSIFHGNSLTTANAGLEGDTTSKNVLFRLINLSGNYRKIVVYYSFLSGQNVTIPVIYKVRKSFVIGEDNSCNVNIYGNEATSIIDESNLTFTYSSISAVKNTLANSGRLLLGNINAKESIYDDLKLLAANNIKAELVQSDEIEFARDITEIDKNGYSDPINIYKYLGYWSGETYEFGVVFITKDGETPVFPVKSVASGWQNNLGVCKVDKGFNITSQKLKALAVKFTMDSVVNDNKDILGLFYVRRERIRDVKYQGLLCDCFSTISNRIPRSTTTLPVMTGPRLGYGPEVDAPASKHYCWAPCPGHLAEWTLSLIADSDVKLRHFMYRGQPTGSPEFHKKAFYSGDVLSRPMLAVSDFSSKKHVKTFGHTIMSDGEHTNTLRSRVVAFTGFKQEIDSEAETTFVDTGYASHENQGFTSFVDRSCIIDVNGSLKDASVSDFKNQFISHKSTQGVFETSTRFDITGELPMISKYQGYIGVNLTNPILNSEIREDSYSDGTLEYSWGFEGATDYWKNPITKHIDLDRLRLGYLTNIYEQNGENSVGDIRNIYMSGREDEPYFAISRRYTKAEAYAEPKVYGGDCYTGLNSCRVWFRGGDPKVSDPKTLTAGDSGGFVDTGFVMSWPSENNYNTNVRMLEYKEGEQTLFSSNRSYFPVRKIDTIKSSFQYDTTLYNNGISSEVDPVLKFRDNTTFPLINYIYPNRVMVSAKSIQSQFKNGFRNFTGSNYRDYSSELGPIVKLLSLQDNVYLICANGISVIQISKQTLIGTEDEVLVDTAKVLPAKDSIISKVYGAQTLHAADVSNFALYGIDISKNVIWQLLNNQFSVISTYNIQKKLNAFKEDLGKDFIGIVKTDKINFKVYFTYLSKDKSKSRTLVYNEGLKLWESELEYHPTLLSETKNGLVLFDALGDQAKLYTFVKGKTCKFKNVQKTFEVEFVVNDASELQKVITNLQLVSNNIAPEKIIYTTHEDDPQTATDIKIVTQDILVRGGDKGKPGYVPISAANCQIVDDKVEIVCQRDWEKDDTSRANRSNRGHNRDIRDKYIRIRLVYSGDKKVVIQKIISTVTLNN